MNLTEVQIKTAQAIVQIFETGRLSKKSYGTITNVVGDSGGLTYGKYQASINSGNLFLLINSYLNTNGKVKNLYNYLDRIKNKDTNLAKDSYFIDLLLQASSDERMIAVQDAFFHRIYWVPVQNICNKHNFNLALSACTVYDSKIHGSWDSISSRVLNPSLPITNIDEEKLWIESYISTRKDWLKNNKNNLLKKCIYRMDSLQEIIRMGNWNLSLPLTVKGVQINIDSLIIGSTIVSNSSDVKAENEEDQKRLLRLEEPLLEGEDVLQIQEALNNKGYSVTLDGIYGIDTKNSIMAFQRSNNLIVDGIVGPSTRNCLLEK